MNKNKTSKKTSITASGHARGGIPEKGSKRALYIRRALEDREEKKRLSSECGDDYWSD
ncbi:PA3496 family putative envelope integrity protein [Endozoicomonas montiporae]|uniref:Uncharacterized protein n=1 Tax=Endozoicomonas montiporae CL-33 TaxID=570277 RepID=A0A142B6I9_9GAMM|nr:hypothetical protein [Endozoicomonas montiporae]AMO54365.1 hypothetical protein EZMO1_0093 [Endozoicomonas montiporae CL-33]